MIQIRHGTKNKKIKIVFHRLAADTYRTYAAFLFGQYMWSMSTPNGEGNCRQCLANVLSHCTDVPVLNRDRSIVPVQAHLKHLRCATQRLPERLCSSTWQLHQFSALSLYRCVQLRDRDICRAHISAVRLSIDHTKRIQRPDLKYLSSIQSVFGCRFTIDHDCWVGQVQSVQDWLALSATYYTRPAVEETINDPSVKRHYWRWRMEPYIENLIEDKELLISIQNLNLTTGRAMIHDIHELGQ